MGALTNTFQMARFSVSAGLSVGIPILNFEGSPLGIDIRKIVNTGVLPVIDTGIAHKEPGHPIVGSGLARPPLECFKKALQQFDKKYSS